MFRPGDVIRLHDRWTTPPKPKLHIVVDLERRQFLRINSKAPFGNAHPLKAAESNFLHHDSFVQLRQLIRHFEAELNDAELMGRLTDEQLTALCGSVERAPTLSDEQKDLVLGRLRPR